jgi:hypothetical protein
MKEQAGNRQRERGVSLYLVALGLIVLMGAAGLGVDLATLYVARNEAQRAADAAALAGASKFGGTAVASGLMTAIQAEPLAAQQASQVGNTNLIIGRNPDLDPENFPLAGSGSSSCPPPTGGSGGCFDFTNPNDPQITVVIRKRMPTYFMRVLGVKSVPISVKAVAEAYTAQGTTGPSTSVKCLKPWLLPNCDPIRLDSGAVQGSPTSKENGNCPSVDPKGNFKGYYQYFVYPPGSPYAGQIVNPGLTPDGVVGEIVTIKPGNPTSNDVSAAGKFWPVFLPTDGTFTCPNCASSDQQNSTSNSAALYRENIECCSDQTIACGYNSVNPISGDMTGPTGQGVDCLIHEQQGSGQDYISLDSSDAVPFTMYSGANNPYTQPAGSVITTSDSLVTLPLYDGEVLCPGNSCPSTVSVDVTGFLQVFIKDEGAPQNTVTAYVLSVSSCEGGSTSNGGGTVAIPGATGTPVAIRLIHN